MKRQQRRRAKKSWAKKRQQTRRAKKSWAKKRQQTRRAKKRQQTRSRLPWRPGTRPQSRGTRTPKQGRTNLTTRGARVKEQTGLLKHRRRQTKRAGEREFRKLRHSPGTELPRRRLKQRARRRQVPRLRQSPVMEPEMEQGMELCPRGRLRPRVGVRSQRR
jgi:hypothetical protein